MFFKLYYKCVYTSVIHELTSSVGRSLEDLKELAQNRTEWKRLVHDVTGVVRDLKDVEEDMYI